MDWNTLLAVVIGGLIATIGSILNNRFQSREKDKDRQEQRREAKIQAREKWIERDILKIMELIEQTLTITSELHNFGLRVSLMKGGKEGRLLSKDEFTKQFKSLFDRVPALLLEGECTFALIEGRVHSFEEMEVASSYTDFKNARILYWQQVSDDLVNRINELGGESKKQIDTHDSWGKMTESAGKLHQALREKLISIRDTEV